VCHAESVRHSVGGGRRVEITLYYYGEARLPEEWGGKGFLGGGGENRLELTRGDSL